MSSAMDQIRAAISQRYGSGFEPDISIEGKIITLRDPTGESTLVTSGPNALSYVFALLDPMHREDLDRKVFKASSMLGISYDELSSALARVREERGMRP